MENYITKFNSVPHINSSNQFQCNGDNCLFALNCSFSAALLHTVYESSQRNGLRVGSAVVVSQNLTFGQRFMVPFFFLSFLFG